MAAGPTLLMEVEIVAVGRIAGVAAPDLEASLRVARKDHDWTGRGLRPVHDIGAIDSLEIAFAFERVGGQIVQNRPKSPDLICRE